MPITDMHEYTARPDMDAFDPQYWDNLFLIWYNRGRPSASKFHRYLDEHVGPDPISHRLPTATTLNHWINGEFTERAKILDEEVERQLHETLVKQKVEMLQRHAEIGRNMQELAWAYLEEHGIGNSRNALLALTQGLEIERESAGVIPFFEKVVDMSDDALILELRKLVSKSPVMIGSNNDDNE